MGPDATSTLHPDTAGSDLYERFESLVRDASRRAFVSERGWRPHAPPRATGVPVPPPAKSIEVSAQFDARAHAGDQRGRRGAPVFVDASAPPRTGPLRTLFLEYAKRDGAFGVERDFADVNANLLSRAEAASMAEDFGVVPALVSPRDAASAFRAADRPAAGAEAAVNREGQLDFREFVGYVVNLAILAFHRPPERRRAVRPSRPRPAAVGDGRPRRRRRDASSVRVRFDGHAKTPRASRRERARRRAQRARHARTIPRRREEGDETVETSRVSSASGGGASRRERGGVRGPSSRRARHATRRRGCGRAEMDRIRGAGVGLRDDPSRGGAAISRARDESKSLGGGSRRREVRRMSVRRREVRRGTARAGADANHRDCRGVGRRGRVVGRRRRRRHAARGRKRGRRRGSRRRRG